MSKISSTLLVCVGLCLSVTSYAAPVPITNAGFETDVFADGGFANGLATGWTLTPGAGTFNPNNTTHMPPSGAPEGQNTLFINSGNVSQVLATNLVGNSIYTLNVEVCDRADGPTPVYLIELLAGATVISNDMSTLAPVAPGSSCLTSTISYTSTQSDPEIGNALQIRLSRTIGAGGQVNYDNIRLDASPVPPVPTLSQWMLGLLIISLTLISFRIRRTGLRL